MFLSTSQRGTYNARVRGLRSARLRHRQLSTNTIPDPAQIAPSSPSVPKRSPLGRLVWGTTLLSVGFYVGSTVASLYSNEYRTFFIGHVPLGEYIIDFTDSQGWDRAPITFPHRDSITAAKTRESKDTTSQTLHGASRIVTATARDVKGEHGEKERQNEAGVATKPAKLNRRVQQRISSEHPKPFLTERPPGIKFSEGVEDLVTNVENALKLSESSGSTPLTSIDNSTVLPDSLKSPPQEDVAPSNLYLAHLPIGFEPPPGYVIPESRQIPPPSNGERSDSLPLVAPQVAPFASSEPIIGQLASTIDSLSLLVASPTSEKTHLQLAKAKADLMNLVERMNSIKAEERAALEKRLNEQAHEYTTNLRDLKHRADERFADQETGWRNSFHEEQQKVIEAYQKKLQSELAIQSEIINARLEEELASQSVELQRKWIRDLKIRVEEEREGRLSKLEELTSSLKKLERLTLDNAGYLDENLRLHSVWSALRSLSRVLASPSRVPFREEMEVLQNAVHGAGDEVALNVLYSLNAKSSPDIGVEPLADLASWFTTSVAPSLVAIALVPDQNAGVLSHLVAHFLSSLQFRRRGLVNGDDVLSVVARVEYYLNKEDLDSATRELNQLVGPSRPLLKDWLDAARRRLEVQQALQILEARATLASITLL